MRIKHGVRIFGVRTEVLFALQIADYVWSRYTKKGAIQDPELTSVMNGEHMPGSLHYVGQACDLSIKNIESNNLEQLKDDLKYRLGPDFDVILSSDHIHIEFQPKKSYGE